MVDQYSVSHATIVRRFNFQCEQTLFMPHKFLHNKASVLNLQLAKVKGVKIETPRTRTQKKQPLSIWKTGPYHHVSPKRSLHFKATSYIMVVEDMDKSIFALLNIEIRFP